MSRTLGIVFILACIANISEAFVHPSMGRAMSTKSHTSLNIFGKKPEEDLSFIESRDMTREEMLELNKKNEDIMNMEVRWD